MLLIACIIPYEVIEQRGLISTTLILSDKIQTVMYFCFDKIIQNLRKIDEYLDKLR